MESTGRSISSLNGICCAWLATASRSIGKGLQTRIDLSYNGFRFTEVLLAASGDEGQASVDDPLVPLDQFSDSRADALERALDLLGQRRLFHRLGRSQAAAFLPQRLLPDLRPGPQALHRPGLAFFLRMVFRDQRSGLRALHIDLRRVALS